MSEIRGDDMAQSKIGKWRKQAKRARRKGLPAPHRPTVHRQPKELDGFYSTAEWKRARYEALVHSNGRCAACGASARFDGVTLRVDHIKPVRLYPHLRLDQGNLQVICNSCNWGKGSWDETDWRPTDEFPTLPNGRSLPNEKQR